MKKSLLIILISIFYFGTTFSQTVYPDYQDGILIFQFKTNVDVKSLADENGLVKVDKISELNQWSSKYGIQEVKQMFPGHKSDLLSHTFQVEFFNASKVLEFSLNLSKSATIEYAERKELHHTTLTPNDPNFTNAANGQWELFQINAEQAWNISTGSSSVVVAVTDNAMNVNHPDLVNKMLPGFDAVDGDNDPSPCGTNNGFHGSHVSGIVGAETNNNLGIASIGNQVSILPIKIGNCSGSLTAGYTGITWAADNGADVINMSWGGGGVSNFGQNVCNYAWGQGAILIAATGNNNSSSIFYPAGYNNVVSVSSTTFNDVKSSFSNFGTWVDISAPGSSILSTNQGTGYQDAQGTSMASPMVAGLVGLMKSHAPSATNTDIINCLYSSAVNIDAANPGFINELGAGRIDAYQALVCASAFSFALDASIGEIFDPIGNICSGTYTPSVELRNYGANTLTSVDIVYQVSGSALQTYSWTGNLVSGQSAIITLPAATSSSGGYTFTASTSSPNGGTDQNISNDSKTNNFNLISNGDQVSLALTLDCYGSETTWIIEDDQNNAITAGGPYSNVAGGEVQNALVCLAPGCYTFTISDSYGDGLYGSQWNSCSVNGDYIITGGSGTLVQMSATNGDFNNSASHSFCITSTNCPVASAVSTDASCFGSSDGSITASANGGEAPLSYSLDGTTYVSSPTFTGLSAGSFTVYVQGSDGCIDSTMTMVSQPTQVSFTSSSSNDICGNSNGSITVAASGGNPGYTYSSNGGSTFQNSNILNNLSTSNYQVIVTDAAGCVSGISSVNVGSTSGPTATVSATDASCNLSNGSITINSIGGTSPYQYSINNGSNLQTNSSFNNIGANSYSVQVVDANGCIFSNMSTVLNLGGNFNLSVSADQSICDGDSAVLIASGVTAGGTYSWDNGLSNGAAQTVTPGVNTTYQVTGTDSYGCSQVTASIVTVNTLPSVIISVDNDTICEGESVDMIASGAQIYSWNTGQTSAIYTVSPAVQTTYTVIGSNGNCSSGPIVHTVYVNSSPNIVAGASSLTAAAGVPINFTSTGSAAINYVWSFGDGATSNQQNVTHTYSSPGTYVVTVNGDNVNCSDSDELIVTITEGSVGIDESSFNEVDIYPNPSTGVINIDLTNISNIASYQIFDQVGKLVVTSNAQLNQELISIDLNGNANGVYYIKLMSDSQTVTRKLILSK